MKGVNTETTYIASCSFGKDSLATILLALENNEPLDRVVFSEVMFDYEGNISGEVPEHIDWIYRCSVPCLERMGLKVDIVRHEFDYLHYFYHKCQRGICGFPLGGKCVINGRCKVTPIRKYIRQFANVIQYIGIAANESKRLARLKDSQISLLDKYGYTERMAYDLCRRYDLISPLYDTHDRGGCWFCPNQSYKSFALLRKNHPQLWDRIVELSKTPGLISYGFKYEKTVQDVEKRMNDIDFKNKYQLKLF